MLLDTPDYSEGALLDVRVKQAGGGGEVFQLGDEAGIRVSDQIHRAAR